MGKNRRWKEYQKNQTVCGIKLPDGLKESAKLPHPIFTPATKEDTGHDMNVEQKYVEELLGEERGDRLKDISIMIYKKASHYALSRGIIIADTKFEFGIYNNEIISVTLIFREINSHLVIFCKLMNKLTNSYICTMFR